MIRALAIRPVLSGRSLTTTPGATIPVDLSSRMEAYEHTITATCGYESCTVSFAARDRDEDEVWADRLLCPMTCYGPDADEVWDGYLAGVELTEGGRTRSYDLATIANRARARYTTFLGSPGATAAASNASSIAIYGTHDYVLSLGTVGLAGATLLRDGWLSRYAFPRPTPQTTLSQPSATDAPQITLRFLGWYTTLDWVVVERTDTSTEDPLAQVRTLLGSTTPGIGAVNGFISTATSDIVGTATATTRKIEADTTYRAAIEQRLGLSDTAGQRFAWGVYEGRRFRVRQWAGASPSVIGYRLEGSRLLNATGAPLPYWRTRPDAMVEDGDALSVSPPSGAVAASGRFYLERVAFRTDTSGMELTLEPEAFSGLDARIARLS